MQIHNAYIINIDFDNDIYCKYANKWLVFTELAEVKDIIVTALKDLQGHCRKQHDTTIISIGEEWDVEISDIIENDKVLEMFIEYGGCILGNWEISIYRTETDN